MLETLYWVAGIVVAVVAVLGLFLKLRSAKTTTNTQNARVSGQNNTVQQNAENRSGEQ
ncbi:hypothetical protein FIV06_01515 [Labrenzia sp. THAF191b]|nr:hypothetical protein FIV06_01515 [Labrenzia sp. THAF191b]QFT02392.1 hypothetical protein FIV05_01515 [Labrenzia sp. THAF191a]QFT13934.1 hypothetical protein FIV03_01520 [Labrenzia sp. THAF187b]